jgi:hypothetical protein
MKIKIGPTRFTALLVFKLYRNVEGYCGFECMQILNIPVDNRDRCAIVEVLLWNADFQLIDNAMMGGSDARMNPRTWFQSLFLVTSMTEMISPEQSARLWMDSIHRGIWTRLQ